MRYWRMLVIVAIAVGLGLSLSGEANASSYAYARQELTNFAFILTGSILSLTLSGSNTANQATLGTSMNTSDPQDASEAYADKPSNSTLKPGQNSFTAKGATDPSWIRADTLITIPQLPTSPGTGAAGSMRTTAEAFLAGAAGLANATASYNWSYTFTVSGAGSIGLKTDYDHELESVLAGSTSGDHTAASYNFTATLTDISLGPNAPHRSLLFDATTNTPLNDNTQRITNGTDHTTDADTNQTSNTRALISGDTYQLSISGTAIVNLNDQTVTTTIPEPGTLLLLGTGLLGLLGYGWRRRRHESAPTSAGASNCVAVGDPARTHQTYRRT